MPYNFVVDSFHTKKLYSRLSSSKVRFYIENGRFVFFRTLWGLGATYDVHLRLIGRCVVDFLLVLIELFSLGVTAEELRAKIDRKSASQYLFKIGDFAPTWPIDSTFHVEGVAPTNHSSSQETRLNVTNHACDRQTDG